MYEDENVDNNISADMNFENVSGYSANIHIFRYMTFADFFFAVKKGAFTWRMGTYRYCPFLPMGPGERKIPDGWSTIGFRRIFLCNNFSVITLMHNFDKPFQCL